MLMLTLPENETEGKCRINGQDAEFKVEGTLTGGGRLSYRHQGGEWKVFHIRYSSATGNGLVMYSCTEAPDESITIIRPLSDKTPAHARFTDAIGDAMETARDAGVTVADIIELLESVAVLLKTAAKSS